MKHSFFVIAILLSAINCIAKEPATAKTIIRNVNVISMEASMPQIQAGQDVYIENGKIKKIKPSSTAATKGYDVVDGTGKYLIPGMADMHAHLPWEKSAFQYRDYYLLNLMNGVTTVRQMRGKPEDLPVRDSVKKGLMVGCNTYISTPPFFFMDDNYNVHFSAASCRDSFAKFRQQGYDFIKYVGGLTLPQYDTFMSIAAALNIKATGHAPRNDLEKAVNSNQYDVEHLTVFTALYQKDSNLFWKTVDNMVAKGLYTCPDIRFYIMDTKQTPTAKRKSFAGMEYLKPGVMDTNLKQADEYVLGFYKRDPIAFAKSVLQDSINVAVFTALLPRLHARGVKMVISPADGDFFVPGFSYIDEMELFVKAGISPYETLKCATYTAAECLEAEKQWGSIAENKQADLVLLSANPLDNITNLREVEMTILGGNVYTQEYFKKALKH